MISPPLLSIGQLARLSGLSAHTIRFYESCGVLRPVGRAANGHRRFLGGDVLWLEFVLRLKQTGMPLSEIRCYAELREKGERTLQPRLAMLELHRQRLVTHMKELALCADALDAKMQTYQRLLADAQDTPP